MVRAGRPRVPAGVRRHFGSVAGVVILAVLLWRLGTGVFLDGLRRIDTPTLLAGLGIGLLTTVLSAWRWCLVARRLGIRLRLRDAVADYYRALFLNAALPGGVLGDVHRAVRHGRDSGDLGRGVRAVVMERTAGQLALVAAGVPVLLLVESPVVHQVRHGVAVLGVVVVGVVAVVAAVRMGRSGAGVRPVPGARRGRAVRAAFVEARGVLLDRRVGGGVLLSSLAVLGGYLLMFLVAARAAGADVSPLRLLPLAMLALIAMGLPLNVGGWGPREGVTAWAFGAAGLGAGTGLSVAVVYGVLSFVASLPGAVVLVVRWVGGSRVLSHVPFPRSPPAGSEAGAGSRYAEGFSRVKYAAKESVSAVSMRSPFSAEASEGRPMTPDSV
ncbi:flippase-like domain-containing protein [Streptomyces sp. NBC_00670]